MVARMSSPTKVLFVIDHYKNPFAGTEGQLFKLIKHLDRADVEPHLLVFTPSEYLNKKEFPCPVTVLGHHRLSSPRTWLALAKAALKFKRSGYQIAHIFFNDPSIIGPPVFRLFGFKVIISRRDMGYWYTPAYEKILRLNRWFVSGAITNSSAVKQITSDVERLTPASIHVIYNGYENAPLEAVVPNDLAERLSPGDLVVGLVANIRPIKRIQDAIAAIATVRESLPQIKLVIVGDGDSSLLSGLADDLKVGERVLFLGGRSDPRRYIQCFDIAILCSESEGFSNAIIEYMQCGKPVICSRVGGNPEIVEDGISGFLYEAGDINALAACLQRLAEQPGLRASMGSEGATIVDRRFSMSTMTSAHTMVYQQLLGKV
jgi:L-malate glycosyltransferase